jgi:hypothetical protein
MLSVEADPKGNATMALLTGQLLFAEREDDVVRLDMIVLARADAPRSPAIGQPLSLELVLPGDGVWRETLVRLIDGWADTLTIVEIDLVEKPGRTMVRVASPLSAITFDEPR